MTSRRVHNFGRGLLLAGIGVAAAQTNSPARPEFELSSVKPSHSEQRRSGVDTSPGKLTVRNVWLKMIVQMAYGVKEYQISGPAWLKSERYDISAKAASLLPDDKMMPMLQTLLEDRFKLALHRETKELPVYVLLAGKNGTKLREAKGNGPSPDIKERGSGHLAAHRMSMPQFANYLAARMDRPVLDLTDLKGHFEITLDWTSNDMAATDSTASPSIFTAVQEKLGLRLEARKAPSEILVIDHVEKVPTEN
jgi:uncharacterized protein (TIGR03435 family)